MFTAIFSLAIGIAALFFGFKTVKLYFKVKRWTLTNATVLSKEAVFLEKPTSNSYPFAVKVEYKYFFDAKEYTNHTVHLIELMGGQSTYRRKSAADKVVNKLGDNIKVYVNPAIPSQAVIFCTGVILYMFVIVMGFFALIYSLSMFIEVL